LLHYWQETKTFKGSAVIRGKQKQAMGDLHAQMGH
jgi:hypothetical protein